MALLLLVVALSVITVFPIISEAQSEQKTFLTHSGAVVQTSGEIIEKF